MVTVNLVGGLGNQLFQYAFGRSLVNKHDVRYLDSCGQYGLWLNRFNTRLPITSVPTGRHISEKSLRYDPNPEVVDDCTLNGYWQCEKYFWHEMNKDSDLRKELTLKDAPSEAAQRAACLIKATPNSVMLHVRRGDYLTWARERHGVLPINYYMAASTILAGQGPDVHFFVFSDDAGYSLPLPYPTTRIACAPHEDLWLMSQCRHAIIANSSFSWWGAWLGPDIRLGTVVAPRQWFAQSNEDAQDIVPSRWLRI